MKHILPALISSLILLACTDNSTLSKYNNALIPASELPSKTYPINADSDALLQDPSGKMLYIPANAFVDEDGKEVNGSINVEFTVLTDMSDVLLAGMTSKTTDGGTLSQEAVFFIDASASGKKLKVKDGVALSYFGEEGKSIYSGEYNKDKKLEWTKKIEPEKFLTTVPLNELDFCPEGVAPVIQRYLPFKGNSVLTDMLRDSVYYSLSARFGSTRALGVFESDDHLVNDTSHFKTLPGCGIDPAVVKTLKTTRFENTLIATKEFEKRLQAIHKSGQRSLLDVYINNLDKPLWQLDSMAAAICYLGDKKVFEDFATQKLGRVEKRVSSDKMKAFFEKEKARQRKEIENLEKKYQKEYQKDQKDLVKLKKTYGKMLQKRQEYRIEKMGWTAEGDWTTVGEFSLVLKREASIKGNFDRVYIYLLLPEIKSLMAVNADVKNPTFNPFPEDNTFMYREGMKIWSIAVCFKDDKIFFAKQEIIGSSDLIIELVPIEITQKQLTEKLRFETSYKDFNKIEEDIAIREKMIVKEKKILEHERLEKMIQELVELIERCPCNESLGEDISKGKEIFEANCVSCHAIEKEKVGPALHGISGRLSMSFIKEFTRNSQKIIRSGNPYAVELYKKYASTEMTAFPQLTDCEIEAMVKYFDQPMEK